MSVRRWRRALGVLAISAGLLSCAGSHEGDDGQGEVTALEILISSPPVEASNAGLFEAVGLQLDRVLEVLEQIEEEERIRGVLIRIGPLGGGYGLAEDLREAVQRVRDAGKPVHCHFEVADNASFSFMARSCDRISATPAGQLDLVGVAAQAFFLRTMLDSIGVRADLMQVGRFKGAAEPFTETEMTPEVRQSVTEMVEGLYAYVAGGVAARGVASEEVDALIDRGPFEPAEARERGLIDDVGFDDEAREHLRRAAGVTEVRRADLRHPSGEASLSEIISVLGGAPPTRPSIGQRVVVVRVAGQIVDSEEPSLDGGNSGPFVRRLRAIADDPDVLAMVLRIDSPGGSALASDRMWHAIQRVARKKMVIASVGNMAASGGYYIASGASRIMAQPTSLVGSIGVVGGKITFGGLFEEAGVGAEIIQRGRNAAWATPTRPFTDEERRHFGAMMRNTYRRFVRRIATARDMTPEQVAPGAEGRIMVGSRALELGLVDEIGGLSSAIEMACDEASLGDDCEVEYWPRVRTPIEGLAVLMGQGQEEELRRALGRVVGAPWSQFTTDGLSQIQTLRRERMLLSLPFMLHID